MNERSDAMDGSGFPTPESYDRVVRTPCRAERRPILIVVHQRRSNPGHIGHWLLAHGYALDIRRPFDGDPLPATLKQHAAALMFGGPMSANDPDDFIRREIDWLAVPLKEDAPFLGVCLGAQMLACHLGARVAAHPDGHAEIGYCPVRATPDGAAMLDWPSHFYQWHCEGFELPDGARRLASSDRFENQAFAYGRAAFGLQFHAEITRLMVHRWTTHSPHMLARPGALPRATHVDGHARHAPAQQAWLDAFMTHWMGLIRH